MHSLLGGDKGHQSNTGYAVYAAAVTAITINFPKFIITTLSHAHRRDVIQPLPYALHHRITWLYQGDL